MLSCMHGLQLQAKGGNKQCEPTYQLPTKTHDVLVLSRTVRGKSHVVDAKCRLVAVYFRARVDEEAGAYNSGYWLARCQKAAL